MVKKSPAVEGRIHDLRIRLSDYEFKLVADEAARLEISKALYLRLLLREHCLTGRPPDEVASALSSLSRQLSAIGNNLNQIAYVLNAGNHAPVSQVLRDIQAANSETRALLRNLRP